MPTIQEMREARAKAVTDARAILNKVGVEKREMSAEETQSYDKAMGEFDRLTGEVDKIEKRETAEKRLADAEKILGEKAEPRTRSSPGDTPGNGGGAEAREVSWRLASGEERRVALEGQRATKEYRSAFEVYLSSGRATAGLESRESRDLAADSMVDGGYLIAPTQMLANILKGVDNLAVVRQYATVMQVRGAQSLGVPTMTADVSDADWTSEIQTGTKDTSLKFGKRELNPTPLAKRALISRKLLRSGVQSVESFVGSRLAYKFGISEEKAFLTGTGANQPLGLFTASADGISTGRDVVTGSATAILADGLIDAKFALKAQYWGRPSTRWLFHRDAMKQIRKLKGSDNNYLWAPGLTAGEPDRVLDIPYTISEYVPNTFTTGLYVGLLGDLSFYWIAEAMAFEIQRLNELYAESNQVGYIGRQELDGMPVLEEAFVRVKTS